MKTAPIAGSGSLERQIESMMAAGQDAEVENLLRSMLTAGSGPLAVWKILASVLRQQRRFEEARDIQKMLVDGMPGNLSLRFDLAETLLMLGEFERGWREYHYRYSLPHTVRIERKVQKPRWNGQPILGQTLLIHDEQGYGDTFQFLRMVPWAKKRSAAKVILEVAPDISSFAQRMEGIDGITLRGSLPPPFHVHCEMMSLPMAMKLEMSELPGPVPYLKADPQRLDHWRQRLADLPRPLVALVWAGRPTPDPKRSMPFNELAALAMDGITFISLQKGPKAAEAKTQMPNMQLVNLDNEITDFDDTAAILSIADLLISIDSAPLHLAGALGRPAWGMLRHVADWRWLLDRKDSPWYPSLRLFRQTSHGNWAGVTSRIAAELAIWRDSFGKKNG